MIRQHLCGRAPDRLVENFPTETFAAVEIAAGLRPVGINRAKHRDRIESDTGAIAALVHAAGTGVLDNKFFRHHLARPQLNYEVAAAAAARTGRKIGVKVDAVTRAARPCLGELYFQPR